MKDNTFAVYCFQLIEQSAPGRYTDEFTKNNNSLSPETYIAYSYKQLLSKWKYVKDIENKDIINSAEETFRNSFLEGDCEDFAVCIMSFCRAKNIDAYFCLAKSIEDKNKGHVWIEIPICDSGNYSKSLREKINKLLDSNLSIYTKSDIIWLCFAPKAKLNKYTMEYKLNIKGDIFKY